MCLCGQIACLGVEGKEVDIAWVGASKAVDAVPHNILLCQLSNCGISVCDNSCGKKWWRGGGEWGYVWLGTGHGVPLGSMLGPGQACGTMMWRQEWKAQVGWFVMIPDWGMILSLWRDRIPRRGGVVDGSIGRGTMG